MEFITYLLNDVVFVLLEGVTLLYMYLYIIDRLDFIRTDIGKTLLYIAIFFFIGNYIVAFESLPRTLIFMVLCTLVLAYLTKTNIYLSAITNIISFLIYGVTEMVVSIIVLYFMDVLFINQTLFERFSTATGVTVDNLSTFEGIAKAAMTYYRWTDEQTPDVVNDGKAFYSADSFFNLAQVGMEQMGTSLFDGTQLQLDTPEFEQIWNNVFECAVKGGYAIYGGYSSDLSKTGDIICSTGSTAGILFYGDEVTYPDNTKEKVEYAVLPYPIFEGGKNIAIQRGSGLIIAKSTPQKEEAAALFLKWFTSPEQNIRFISSTGYLPVTNQAFTDHMEGEIAENSIPNVQKLLRTAIDVHKRYDFYIPPVFDEFNTISESFESRFLTLARQRREQYLINLETNNPDDAYEKAAKNALNEFILGQP
jgi:multiple sugar transport system substrate-binding protein